MQIDPNLSFCTKQVQVDQRPHIKLDVLNNLIEEKVGHCLEHIGIGDKFPNRTPIAQGLRSTINKMDLMKPRAPSIGQNRSLQNG
jgi:predicted HAD superfamily phosphohydrolase YqeG